MTKTNVQLTPSNSQHHDTPNAVHRCPKERAFEQKEKVHKHFPLSR